MLAKVPEKIIHASVYEYSRYASIWKGNHVNRHPREIDCKVTVGEDGVEVIFTPTQSVFKYRFLAIKSRHRLSRSKIYVAMKSDTGGYLAEDVEALAYRIASAAISRRKE